MLYIGTVNMSSKTSMQDFQASADASCTESIFLVFGPFRASGPCLGLDSDLALVDEMQPSG
jgi:hypothetical protein